MDKMQMIMSRADVPEWVRDAAVGALRQMGRDPFEAVNWTRLLADATWDRARALLGEQLRK